MKWFDKYIKNNPSVFIIAEAGINHNGYFDLAMELVKQAKQAGADCVKFQTFRTSASESKHSSKPDYFQGRIGGMTKIEWSKSLEFSIEQFAKLKAYCEELDIAFLSTACDIKGFEILENIRAQAIKIASADTNNDYLLAAVGKSRLPVLLSTGMSSEDQIRHAIDTLRINGTDDIALFQCTSQYPTPYDQIHLKVMNHLKNQFKYPVGLSDHSQGIHIPVAAVAMGAKMIEKHFTLSRNLPGVDHTASLDPDEFKQMVHSIRDVEKAMGSDQKAVQKVEEKNAQNMRRSLMAARDLGVGTILTSDDITAKRPGTGLSPDHIHLLLGKKLMVDLLNEDMFELSMVSET